MANIIVILILVLIVFLAIRHIYKEKKNGAHCCGCLNADTCNKSSGIMLRIKNSILKK